MTTIKKIILFALSITTSFVAVLLVFALVLSLFGVLQGEISWYMPLLILVGVIIVSYIYSLLEYELFK